MTKKDILEELREENERLKKELEISKLERENEKMRREIDINKRIAKYWDFPYFFVKL